MQPVRPLRIARQQRGLVELKRRGVAILLVEQNARAALQTADYAYVLETGEITLEGPARELASDSRVVESYLGLGGRVSAMLEVVLRKMRDAYADACSPELITACCK